MKKKIKWIILVVIALYIGALVMEKLDTRPFKFEKFKTKEEAQAFFEEFYSKGTSLDIIIRDAKKAGATCRLPTQHELSEQPLLLNNVFCDYRYGLLIDIEWHLSIKRSDNLVERIYVSKTSTTM
jgi:hypothetical protein